MELNRENLHERFSEDTLKLLDLAQQAGIVAQESRRSGLQISAHAELKGFVTSGDTDIDRLIHSEAGIRLPDAVVLSEETRANFNPQDHREILIVDSIDGTRWYKDGGEIWSINLSLVRDGEIVSAVIFQPDLGVLTFAEKGLGAYCQKNGEIARIYTNPETDIKKSKIAVGTNYASYTALTQISELQKQIALQSRGGVSMESSGYELACLARGLAFTAYIHPYAKPWDKVAGMLIINEAGGIVSGWPGKDGIFEDGIIAAANQELYAKISNMVRKYIPEDIHDVPGFDVKKRKYFQDFMVRHLSEARIYKQQGLLNEEGPESWRNVARHQLLSGVITETIGELLGMPVDKIEEITHWSLIHDVDKRRQQGGLSKTEVYIDEHQKTGRPLVATGSNFTDFASWGIDEYILRYVDSSVGEDHNQKTAGHWFGPRDPSDLPEVLILPWRQRIAMFKTNKQEEGQTGIRLYGMTTWDKLEQVMETIERSLFEKIIQNNPDLAGRYADHSQLTQLVEDRIHEKILSS